jgi:HK97 family phage major capsid protein
MNLKDILNAKVREQSAILDKAMAENRAMTEDEHGKVTAMEAEIKNLESQITLAETITARNAANATPANAPIFAEPNSHKPMWNSMSEFIVAVRNAGTPGGKVDNRLRIQNAASGLNETIGSEGGFFVQQDLSSKLLKRAYETGQLASRCEKIPISNNSNSIKFNSVDETSRANGSRYGGIVTYWEGEADEFTASKPKFIPIELSLKKLTALCYFTNELLADAAALPAMVEKMFAEEMAFKLDDAILRGNGTGQPLGILNSKALITVPKTASQTADTITLNNVQDMWSRRWSRSSSNMIWITNQDCEKQLQNMVIPTGTYSGATVFMPPGGVSGAPYATVMGRPILVMEQAATLGDKGDLVLADLSQFVLIDKGGVETAESIHVRFIYDESVFRFIYRVDGQPIWRVPLTPYKGSNTVGPFITLAERA